MKSGWEIKKLGDVCKITNGSTPLRTNKEFWDNGDFPWFTIEDIREQGRIIRHTKQQVTELALQKLRVLPKQSVLLCCTASVGEYAISEIELTTNQQFNGLTIKRSQELSPMFLFYFSSTLKELLIKLSGKATIDFVPISRLKEISIPVPPLPEQHRIIAILDDAFDAIDKAKENTERNLQNARELFESQLQNLLHKSDKGYIETTIGAEVNLQVGFAFKSAQYTNATDAIKLLRGDNIVQGSLRWDDVQKWPAADTSKYSRYNLNNGDVVLAMDRPWVKAGIKIASITEDDLPCLLVQRTARLRGGDRVDNQFLLYLLSSNKFTRHILGVQTGIGVPHISGQQIKDFQFLKPPLNIQCEIVNQLDALSTETKKLEVIYNKKLADLEELKKSILQKAFNGEL